MKSIFLSLIVYNQRQKKKKDQNNLIHQFTDVNSFYMIMKS